MNQNDIHPVSIPGNNSRTMVCCHGYGANYEIAQTVKSTGKVDATIIGFNFPDHDIDENFDPEKATFGTIQELLPAFYVLKKCILDEGKGLVDLYGFSAGGSAVVNIIGVLRSSTYDQELKEIGIGKAEKDRLLKAIQNGIVILDAPLKSVDEIIDLRGSSAELEAFAKNYRKNHLQAIDVLDGLKGLNLNILVYFEEPDDVVYNRDDALFVEKLKKVGKVSVITGNEGGHNAIHTSLWDAYSLRLGNAT